jgi:exonuclease VII large subunit
MAAKKRSSSEKELEKTVRKLRTKLERSDTKVKQWKKRAVQSDKALATSQARVKKLERRLDKAAVPATPEAVEAVEAVEPQHPAAAEGPDPSWTVVQLRAEARSRGITGLSNKSKAQLLDALG